MKHYGNVLITGLCCLVLVAPVQGNEQYNVVDSSSEKSRSIEDMYPGLTMGALSYAVAYELPEGVLLKAGRLVINDKELTAEINEADEQVRSQLRKNGVFVLEQIAAFKLLLREARTDAAKNDTDISEKDDKAIIQDYLQTLVKKVEVADSEIIDFYNGNKETFGGATLAQIRPQIKQFLLQQKQQEYVDEHVRIIGKRMQIEVSASWLKTQAASAQDNPVDKARASGMASLVDFGSTGCVPCEMMAPILKTLREKYKGKIDVLFIHVGEKPILASRYGVQSIPVQIFFDKTGKEVFRHVGFFSQEQIEEKLVEMGINY